MLLAAANANPETPPKKLSMYLGYLFFGRRRSNKATGISDPALLHR